MVEHTTHHRIRMPVSWTQMGESYERSWPNDSSTQLPAAWNTQENRCEDDVSPPPKEKKKK